MAAIAAGKPARAVPPNAARPVAPPTLAPTDKPAQQSLAALIVSMIQQAGHPLTVKQLTEEARRQGFPSTSADFAEVVKSRVAGLRKKGILQRAADQPGYTLTRRADGRARKGRPSHPASQSPARGRATSVAAGNRTKRAPLRLVLTEILKKSTRPMTGSDLATAARKAGWRTKSERPTDVVWAMLHQMDNVEHIKGEGYRLKKGRA
jgi:hypothetical protein